MRRPRMPSISRSLAPRRSVPPKRMRSAVIRAVGSSFSSARPIVDLPEPLSPTMPSFSRPTVNETSRTAST